MIVRKIVIWFCNNIRHFSNKINKRGGGIFLWRLEFFKIGKGGLQVYQRDESKQICLKVPILSYFVRLKSHSGNYYVTFFMH